MHRYTLDTVSRSLVFDKTDASLLGCGSSAVVYKGMLDDRPVALKVDASSLGSSVDGHRASPRLAGIQARRTDASCPRKGRVCFQDLPSRAVGARVQVYEEMKSELAIMAQPRDPTVLVGHGVYGICVATSPSHP